MMGPCVLQARRGCKEAWGVPVNQASWGGEGQTGPQGPLETPALRSDPHITRSYIRLDHTSD